MNKIIKEQLYKVKTTLPQWDDNTTHMVIKATKQQISEEISAGDKLLIKVEDYIIHPFDGFDLHVNWNNGVVPKSKYFSCTVLQVMGKMVKIDGYGISQFSREKNGEHWIG